MPDMETLVVGHPHIPAFVITTTGSRNIRRFILGGNYKKLSVQNMYVILVADGNII